MDGDARPPRNTERRKVSGVGFVGRPAAENAPELRESSVLSVILLRRARGSEMGAVVGLEGGARDGSET